MGRDALNMDARATDLLPRIKNVSSARQLFSLTVEWADGKKSKVDLTGLVHRSRHFGVFADELKAFARVKPDEFGSGLEWNNGLDCSARTLKVLADEQKTVAGTYLRKFEAAYGLSTDETAKLLDVTPRTVVNWRKNVALPRTVYIALRRFECDPTAFAAFYRPVKSRPRGRPKAKA